MLYKEWTTVRTKFLIWVLIYAGALGVFLMGYFQQFYHYESLFQSWLGITCLVMAVVAALGGVDLVAEEKAQGTLSFLLTRPVSRNQIYISKLGMNIAALAAAFIPTNLLVLVIDQLNPTPITIANFVTQSCGENRSCSGWQTIGVENRSADVLQSLLILGLILLFGVGVICMAGMISIFASNTVRSVFLTIPALTAFIIFISFTAVTTNYLPGVTATGWDFNVRGSTSLQLFGAAVVFFWGGLVAFKRKEF